MKPSRLHRLRFAAEGLWRAMARSYIDPGLCRISRMWVPCHRPRMKSRPEPGYSALRKGRHSEPGRIYFVSAVTDQRIPWFQLFSCAQLLCRGLEQPESLGDAENLCWVVMPDHFHLLVQINTMPLPRIMNRLKSRSTVLLNRDIGRSGRFWAPGYYDHALRKEEDIKDVARYIVANPLRAGLVRSLGDYPFWNAVWL